MISTQQMTALQAMMPRTGQMLGKPALQRVLPNYEQIATNMAVTAERRRTGLDQQSARNEIAMQEQKQPPSVLARRRKQFLEGTILGSLMPEPSIELGAPMSMLGSSTLLGS